MPLIIPNSPPTFTHLSEMRVAKKESLARTLQDSADPSRLLLSAFMAMILQMLLTAGRFTQSPHETQSTQIKGHILSKGLVCSARLGLEQNNTIKSDSKG